MSIEITEEDQDQLSAMGHRLRRQLCYEPVGSPAVRWYVLEPLNASAGQPLIQGRGDTPSAALDDARHLDKPEHWFGPEEIVVWLTNCTTHQDGRLICARHERVCERVQDGEENPPTWFAGLGEPTYGPTPDVHMCDACRWEALEAGGLRGDYLVAEQRQQGGAVVLAAVAAATEIVGVVMTATVSERLRAALPEDFQYGYQSHEIPAATIRYIRHLEAQLAEAGQAYDLLVAAMPAPVVATALNTPGLLPLARRLVMCEIT